MSNNSLPLLVGEDNDDSFQVGRELRRKKEYKKNAKKKSHHVAKKNKKSPATTYAPGEAPVLSPTYSKKKNFSKKEATFTLTTSTTDIAPVTAPVATGKKKYGKKKTAQIPTRKPVSTNVPVPTSEVPIDMLITPILTTSKKKGNKKWSEDEQEAPFALPAYSGKKKYSRTYEQKKKHSKKAPVQAPSTKPTLETSQPTAVNGDRTILPTAYKSLAPSKNHITSATLTPTNSPQVSSSIPPTRISYIPSSFSPSVIASSITTSSPITPSTTTNPSIITEEEEILDDDNFYRNVTCGFLPDDITIHEFSYVYNIGVNGKFSIEEMIRSVENQLLQNVIDNYVLVCVDPPNTTRQRRLNGNGKGIAGVSAMPKDTVSGTCGPDCISINGGMTFFDRNKNNVENNNGSLLADKCDIEESLKVFIDKMEATYEFLTEIAIVELGDCEKVLPVPTLSPVSPIPSASPVSLEPTPLPVSPEPTLSPISPEPTLSPISPASITLAPVSLTIILPISSPKPFASAIKPSSSDAPPGDGTTVVQQQPSKNFSDSGGILFVAVCLLLVVILAAALLFVRRRRYVETSYRLVENYSDGESHHSLEKVIEFSTKDATKDILETPSSPAENSIGIKKVSYLQLDITKCDQEFAVKERKVYMESSKPVIASGISEDQINDVIIDSIIEQSSSATYSDGNLTDEDNNQANDKRYRVFQNPWEKSKPLIASEIFDDRVNNDAVADPIIEQRSLSTSSDGNLIDDYTEDKRYKVVQNPWEKMQQHSQVGMRGGDENSVNNSNTEGEDCLVVIPNLSPTKLSSTTTTSIRQEGEGAEWKREEQDEEEVVVLGKEGDIKEENNGSGDDNDIEEEEEEEEKNDEENGVKPPLIPSTSKRPAVMEYWSSQGLSFVRKSRSPSPSEREYNDSFELSSPLPRRLNFDMEKPDVPCVEWDNDSNIVNNNNNNRDSNMTTKKYGIDDGSSGGDSELRRAPSQHQVASAFWNEKIKQSLSSTPTRNSLVSSTFIKNKDEKGNYPMRESEIGSGEKSTTIIDQSIAVTASLNETTMSDAAIGIDNGLATSSGVPRNSEIDSFSQAVPASPGKNSFSSEVPASPGDDSLSISNGSISISNTSPFNLRSTINDDGEDEEDLDEHLLLD